MFLNQLIQFEAKWGTGIQVVRQISPNTADPDTFIAGATPSAENIILNTIRFIETTKGDTKELLDQFGLQQGQVYNLHFRTSDGIRLNDIVYFNTYLEKTRTAYDSTQPISKIRVLALNVGDEDHQMFTGVTFN